jgi:hypothetical protein
VIPIRKYDTEYWRSTSAGLQREVDHQFNKNKIAQNIITTIAGRIELTVEEVNAGRLGESEALAKLNNLAQVVFRAIDKMNEQVHAIK